MSLVTTKQVIEATQDLINEGRSVKVKIEPYTSPMSVIHRCSPEDMKRLDKLNLYNGISANDYAAQASILWVNLFWKIGEQILIVANYNSEFQRFYTELNVGADIEEIAPRIKDGIDRHTLSNSALLANYTTVYDSFYHRINQFKVFATTYYRQEIERLSQSWDNITTMLNAELQNILLSASHYIHNLSKDALVSQYLSGGMHDIHVPVITDANTAAQNAIAINTAIDAMTVELNELYIPFNLNANNADPHITDIATSNIWLIATAELLNNVEFLTTLNTYFQGKFDNSRFSFNTIKVMDFPTAISPNIQITPGYTPLVDPPIGNIKGFLVEENAFIFKQKLHGSFNFDNAATLNTSIFHHLDAMANLSDRRKSVAIVN